MSSPGESKTADAPHGHGHEHAAGHDHDGHGRDGHDGHDGHGHDGHGHEGHGHEHAGHHGHGGHDHAAHASRRALAIALGITVSFLLVEAVAGWITHSLALIADAGHMLSDALGLGAALFVAGLARRPRTARNTYGFRRAEVLAALFNAVLLVFSVFAIVSESMRRLADPPEVGGVGLLGVASGGLVANLIAAWVLHREGGDSVNVRAALLHVVGDALGSVAAMVAGVLVLAFGWRLADPLASLAIAILLSWGIWQLLKEATAVLMESSPEGIDVHQVQRTIAQTPGVASVHDLHVWSVVRGQTMLTAHVVLTPGVHGTDVASQVCQRLRSAHRIEHATIQPEAPEPPLVSLRRKA